METGNIVKQFGTDNPHKNKVHKILAHSYLFYFISLLFGLFLDFAFPLGVFGNSIAASVGIIFLVFGTFLIFWAQISSHKLKKENMSKETFCCGPYRYSRSPTHFGLFFLTLGFGIIANALFIVIFSIISFLITKFVFIKKEEEILVAKYGAPYLEYKKVVKL